MHRFIPLLKRAEVMASSSQVFYCADVNLKSKSSAIPDCFIRGRVGNGLCPAMPSLPEIKNHATLDLTLAHLLKDRVQL